MSIEFQEEIRDDPAITSSDQPNFQLACYIDYRCDDGRFPLPASWLAIAKLGGIYLTETCRPETLQPGLEIVKSQPRSEA